MNRPKQVLEELKKVKENLGLMIRNRLTLAKTLLGLAVDRRLTPDESQKATEHLESVIKLVDAEMTILILKLEQER